jgi:hypothetical protein
MKNKQAIIIVGQPLEDFLKFIGPFEDSLHAEQYALLNCDKGNWQVKLLEPLGS